MQPFSITRLSTQLSYTENVAISNCVIRHGSIMYDSSANNSVLWWLHIQPHGREGMAASPEPTKAAGWPFIWNVLHLQMVRNSLDCFPVITLEKWRVAVANAVSKEGWLPWAFVPYVKCALSHLLSTYNSCSADFCWGKCQHKCQQEKKDDNSKFWVFVRKRSIKKWIFWKGK